MIDSSAKIMNAGGKNNVKALVIYFSQTGNTRKIAECIHDGIIDVIGQCDITTMNDVDVKFLPDYDLVGIGCPVFYLQEPFNVRYFIDSLPELRKQHWFIFCTHGNIMGNIFPLMQKRLIGKGATVIGFHNSYAGITVPFHPSPSFTTGHPDSYDLEQAKAFGREIAKRSPQITNPDSDLIPAPPPVSSEEVQQSYMLTPEYLGQIAPKLNIDMEKCTQCHICESNCPVQGIDIEANPPRIQTPCIYCWRCVNVCPTLAINANWGYLVSTIPAYYARFRKMLDEAAAHGKFRWLIDPDTINCNDPLYKQREREIKSKEIKNPN